MKPKRWWTDDLSLIRICETLLHILYVWLKGPRCKHYFISNCNLVDNSFELKAIASRLASISKSWLASWFVNNYIQKCAWLCPRNVSQLFDDVSTIKELQNAASAIVDWRQSRIQLDLCSVFEALHFHITEIVSVMSLTVWSLYYWLTELLNISSSSSSVIFVSIVLLHIARRISSGCFPDELMDVLAVVVGVFIGPRRYSIRRSSGLLLSQVVKCLKSAANESDTTVQLIEIELSRAYLYRALRCKDSDSDSIYCLANVYLAVLYYTTGQYQTAIDHCTLVTRSF